MKIAVVGAGAMGAIVGAALHEAGHETTLLDVAAPLVERINSDGITLEASTGVVRTVAVPATTDPAAGGRAHRRPDPAEPRDARAREGQ